MIHMQLTSMANRVPVRLVEFSGKHSESEPNSDSQVYSLTSHPSPLLSTLEVVKSNIKVS